MGGIQALSDGQVDPVVGRGDRGNASIREESRDYQASFFGYRYRFYKLFPLGFS